MFILNILCHPKENANHYSNYITGIPRNIPSNPVEKQFGNNENRAAPYCPVC
jgi:hypothetical protein